MMYALPQDAAQPMNFRASIGSPITWCLLIPLRVPLWWRASACWSISSDLS